MRHFVNRLADFVQGSRAVIDEAFWKHQIQSYIDQIIRIQPATSRNCDGGLYVGCAGISYMFYYVANSKPFADRRDEMLTVARNYLNVSLSYAENKDKDPSQAAAFLLGTAGVYAVGSLISNDIGKSQLSNEMSAKYLALSAACQPVNFLSCGSDELFVGRAGYLCGAALINRKFGKQVINEAAINKVCQSIMHSGREYAKRHRSPSSLMYAYYGTEYLGAAHGLCAILQMLLTHPCFWKSDPAVEAEIHECVDFMLSILQPNGNLAPAMDELGGRRPSSQELVHWCHGGPGVVYLFAKAFLLWRDDKYLDACLRCGELTWQKGLLRKGPGICHGVAGSGYVFLLLYRLTADEKHLHRAVRFAEFLLTEEFQTARTPDCAASLYEGLAGTVCFLVDLMQPDQAEFPFFDVFYNS